MQFQKMGKLMNPVTLMAGVAATALISDGALHSDVSFSRSSAAYAWLDDLLTSFSSNTPRFANYEIGDTYTGLIIEGASVNGCINNSMTGAEEPSTFPTGWGSSFFGGTGLTAAIEDVGTEYGMPYVDINISGTAVGNQTYILQPFAVTDVEAAPVEVWTGSFYGKTISGDVPSDCLIHINAWDDMGGYISESGSAFSFASSIERISTIRTLPALTAYVSFYIGINFNNLQSYDCTFRMYKPQLEEATFASTPISTTTASVTRAADVCGITNLDEKSWFNSEEYTIVVDFLAENKDDYRYVLSITDGTSDNRLEIFQADASQSYAIGVEQYSGGVLTASAIGSPGGEGQIRLAIRCKANDFAVYKNGSVMGTPDMSNAVVVDPTDIKIGRDYNNANHFFGPVGELLIYPTGRDNTQLATFSTIA